MIVISIIYISIDHYDHDNQITSSVLFNFDPYVSDVPRSILHFVLEHIYGPETTTRSQRAMGWLFGIALFGAIAAAAGCFAYQKKQKDSAKRFY